MGAVWRARYHRRGLPPLPVAVKVLHDLLVDDAFRARFHAEVRAMVGLDHPRVVWVFDHGDVPEGHPQLPSGAPWVAMELASYGTLDDHRRDLDWPTAHAVLRELLDVLAHAHAHGVVHRDLKPANVLVCGPGDLRPGLKLTDFGIAARLDDTAALDAGAAKNELVGTPSYMAPEQVSGVVADLGPWTDLYALGCVAWELVTGRPPFHDMGPRDLLFAHLARPVGPLEPRMDVPDGVEPWLRGLLAKHPEERYQRAADARAVLEALAPGEAIARRVGELELALPPPTPSHLTQVPMDTWLDELSLDVPAGQHVQRPPHVAPSCPRRWQRLQPARRQRQLQGAGLALVGLRSVPLAGREVERDRLWSELLRVVGGEVRAVVLSGAAGTGKTRLADWLRIRAEEVGVVTGVVARHTPETPEGDGVRQALRRLWRGPRQRAWADRLGVELAAQVTDWLARHHEPSVAERHALVGAVLGTVGRERPVLLHLDDVQWAPDALALARALVERARVTRVPLLVVVTVQDEALAERPAVAAALEAWARDGVASVAVPPLDVADQADLLDGLLHLDPAVAQVVLQRAGGHPLFAIQQVSEWVDRGWLVPTTAGFAFDRPTRAEEELSLDDLWTARLDRVLASFPPATGPWLERAGLWGDEVSHEAFASLGEGLGIDLGLADGVIDALARSRLAVARPEGFAFAHGLVREALQRRAGDRRAAHHARVAELRHREPIQAGRHWLLAGEPERAVDSLLAGLEGHARQVGARAHAEVVELAERALREAGVDEADERWWTVLRQRLWVLQRRDRSHEVDELLERLHGLVEAHGWPGRAVLARAEVSRAIRDEDVAAAERWIVEAEAAAVTDDDRVAVAVQQMRLGEKTNDLARAAAAVQRVAAVLSGGAARARVRASMHQCVAGLMIDDMDLAEPHADDAVALAEELGDVTLLARSLHHQGKVSWNRGRYGEAAQRLARSEGLFLRAGDPGLGNPRLVRIQVFCAQGRYDEALALALDLVDRGLGDRSVKLLIAVARVGRGEVDLVLPGLDELCEGFEARRRCNGEDALALEALAALLEERERPEAVRVLQAALDQWTRHDLRDGPQARVEARLTRMGSDHTDYA